MFFAVLNMKTLCSFYTFSVITRFIADLTAQLLPTLAFLHSLSLASYKHVVFAVYLWRWSQKQRKCIIKNVFQVNCQSIHAFEYISEWISRFRDTRQKTNLDDDLNTASHFANFNCDSILQSVLIYKKIHYVCAYVVHWFRTVVKPLTRTMLDMVE